MRILALATIALLSAAGIPQESKSPGDPLRIAWVRPFKEALKRAKETRRLVFTKPLIGGTNTPKPGGKPAGGKDDCDGSW